MYKIRLSIIILNFISIIALIVFVLFTYLQINNIQPKYGLSKDAIKFNLSANSYLPNLNNIEKIVFNQIQEIIYDEEIVIINYNISKMGLGVYDSKNSYKEYKLIEGVNIKYNEFKKEIILKDNSYFIGKNTIKSVDGTEFSVVGVYNVDYPLYNETTEYIYNIFVEPTVYGDFYIESKNEDLINKIFNIFEANDYSINFDKTNNNMLSILTYGLYIVTCLGVFLIYFNLYMYYRYYYNRVNKIFKIHILYGAEYKKLVFFCLKNFVLNHIIGTILGVIFYYVVFKNSDFFNIKLTLVSILLGGCINVLLFNVCLLLKKSAIYKLIK